MAEDQPEGGHPQEVQCPLTDVARDCSLAPLLPELRPVADVAADLAVVADLAVAADLADVAADLAVVAGSY